MWRVYAVYRFVDHAVTCRSLISACRTIQNFCKPGAAFKLPVYHEGAVQSYLAAKAQSKGVDLSDLLNDLLKKEIEIIETVK